MSVDNIVEWIRSHPLIAEILNACGILLLSAIAYLITKRVILRGLRRLVQRTRTNIDDILLRDTTLRRLSIVVPLVIINLSAHLFAPVDDLIRRVSVALIAWFLLLTFGSLLTAANEVYNRLAIAAGRPIKGYVQIVKLIIYIAGGIIIVSVFLGRSPLVLLSGFGAMTAVILLIFRDTILSFVASLQISSNDLVRVGDWIDVPTFGADGDVVDIALHTVTVQNWDKTLTIIPTHKLIDNSFKNWRGMQLSGGRRIKRAIHIDINSIRFCDDAMIERFRHVQILRDYIDRKLRELEEYNRKHDIDTNVLVNGRRMTNVGTFRAYVKAYLQNHSRIHQDMTFLVRQLQPDQNGLPIEIYVFTKTTAWADYEAIQADIFDHILAVVPEFDLRVFQSPSGKDFGLLVGGASPMAAGGAQTTAAAAGQRAAPGQAAASAEPKRE